MARHWIGTAEREPPLQRQRIAADPSAAHEPDVDPTRWADAGVVADIEKQPVEAIRPGRDRVAHRRRDARVRHDVGAAGIFQARPHQPAGRRLLRIVAAVEDEPRGDRREVPFIDRRIRAPRLGIAEHGPRVLIGHARLPLVA